MSRGRYLRLALATEAIFVFKAMALAVAGLTLVVAGAADAAAAGTTTRVSVASDGTQANSGSSAYDISGDSRYVAFFSDATNLVAGDTNGTLDVFLADTHTGVTTRVSVASDGSEADGPSALPTLSGDGRYVAFHSIASNLVPGDDNGAPDVFVRDLQTGVTTRVSVAPDGTQANGGSTDAEISADGGSVAFVSAASNLVSDDTNAEPDVFVRDLQTGVTTRVSVASDGSQANSASLQAAISADGRYVALQSFASNLEAGDTNGVDDVFVHDTATRVTSRVSIASDGSEVDASCNLLIVWSPFQCFKWPAISADGRYVGFVSTAPDLVDGDTNQADDVFVRDTQNGVTSRVSVASDGSQANDHSPFKPTISADGRYVAFGSDASNLVADDTNSARDIFVRDVGTAVTSRVSVASDGSQANGDSPFGAISDDGRYVAFHSGASNLVPGDTNGRPDVFLHDRSGTPSDVTPPTLTAPDPIVVEATFPTGANVSYSVTVRDNTDPDPTLVCSPASGDTFPLGTTTVTCTATDDAGNTTTAEFTVTVQDTTAPELVLPSDRTVDAISPDGAVVTFTVRATDLVDLTPTVDCVPPSGSTFPIGTTVVECTAADDHANSSRGSFTIHVEGAEEQLADLAQLVDAVISDQQGLATSLHAKLDEAMAALAAGDTVTACEALDDFVNEVSGLRRGGRILAADADLLTIDATRVQAVLGC